MMTHFIIEAKPLVSVYVGNKQSFIESDTGSTSRLENSRWMLIKFKYPFEKCIPLSCCMIFKYPHSIALILIPNGFYY